MTVQEVVDWARIHVRLAPIVNVGGFTGQPAIAIAQDVKLAIINQTYNWWWNRKSIPSFLTANLTYDYVVLPPDFGWLERGYHEEEASTAQPKPKERIEVVSNLPVPLFVGGWPTRAAAEVNQFGTRLLRVDPIPSTIIFRMYFDYQMKVQVPTALTHNFDPIPDDMNDIIRQFFLAFAFRTRDKDTYLVEEQKAKNMLLERKGASKPEQDTSIGFYPERSLFIG